MLKFYLPLLLLVPTWADINQTSIGDDVSPPIVAVIEAPDKVSIGDLVILDGSKSTGDNHLWVVDPRVTGRFLELDDRIVFAIGTPGTYSFQLIVADKEANISQTKKNITVGGTVPPPPIDPGPNPPTDPPPPVTDQSVFKATKAATDYMNDSVTAKELHNAISALSVKTPETVQVATGEVFFKRKDQSKNWLTNWRVPINMAIERSGLPYPQAIDQVLKGLSDTSIASDSTIVFYTRENCPPCEQWKTNEAPLFLSYGWAIRPERTTTKPTPTFEIRFDGRTILHQGYLGFSDFSKLISSLR